MKNLLRKVSFDKIRCQIINEGRKLWRNRVIDLTKSFFNTKDFESDQRYIEQPQRTKDEMVRCWLQYGLENYIVYFVIPVLKWFTRASIEEDATSISLPYSKRSKSNQIVFKQVHVYPQRLY